MPRGMGRRFRKMISGLLFLSVLVMSVVQAHSTVSPVMHGGMADAMAPLSAHHHTGSPCKGQDGARGLACCFVSGCSTMSGWLFVPTTVLPAIMPATLVYPDSSPVRPDGLQFAPALPPPRRIV